MEKVVIKTNRIYWLIMLIGCTGFSLSGLLLALYDTRMPAIISWDTTIFFGACIPLFIWQFIDSRPLLIIDDNGIYDRRLKIGTIGWTEIEGAYIKSLHRQDFICLQLKDYEKLLPKSTAITRALAQTNVALGFTPVSIAISGADANIHQVLDLILKKAATVQK